MNLAPVSKEEGCLNLIGAIVGQAKDDYYDGKRRLKQLHKNKTDLEKEARLLNRGKFKNRIRLLAIHKRMLVVKANISSFMFRYDDAHDFIFNGERLNNLFIKYGVQNQMNAGYIRKMIRQGYGEYLRDKLKEER